MHIYSRRIKSGSSNNKKLAVFDFKVTDDNDVRKKSKVENNPRNVNNPVCDKYTFLETIAVGKSITVEEINYESSLDIDTINVSHIATNLLEDPSRMMVESNDALTAVDNPPESVPKIRPDVPESEVSASAEAEVNIAATSASPCNDQSSSPLLDSLPSLTEPVCSDKAPESEVSAPSGADVNVADESNSPMLDSMPSLTEFVCTDKAPESEVSAPSGAEDNVAATSASPCNEQLNSAILDLLPSLTEPVCSDEALEMDQHENGSMCERSPAFSDFAEDDGAEPSSDHCIDGWEMESQDSEDLTTVVLYPDYVMYRDGYYTNYMISFTENFIEMEGSTRDGDDQTFKCKWGIEDVLHIRCHLFEGVEMANVKIHVLNGTIHTENVAGTELKFAVSDPSWYDIVDQILSLNAEYKALWSSVLESEENVLRQTGVSFSKYLPTQVNFDRPFEEVVYPKGDADAVSISKRDFDLLQPDTFLNDTIIDFYIKYLKNKIIPDERDRYHFFNSFFFRKLADPDKDPLDASRGREGFQRVKKWTRKVKLFEKDFIFIPVNYNYHWSLIVICHLGEVATYEDEDANELSKVPCILHMDSIRGSHAGLKDLVQSYLKEEWTGRQQVESEDISSRFDNLRFIYLELPQQLNSYDCGLFLLHYVELFLEQTPMHFNPFKTTNNSNFLNVDWFPPAEASLKRVVIQKLICDLLENPHQEESSSAAINDEQCHLSRPTTDVHKGTVVNLSQQDCNPSLLHQISQDNKEIEISLIPSSSIQCADDPHIDLKPSFESASFVGTPFPNFNHTNSFNEYKCSLTPIAEDVDGDEQFVYTRTESRDQQENDDSALPYSSQDFQTQESWHATVISDHEAVNNNIILSQEASISCEDSIEIVNDISQLDSEHTSKKRRDQPRSRVYATFAMYHQMGNGNGNVDPTPSMDMLPGSSFT